VTTGHGGTTRKLRLHSVWMGIQPQRVADAVEQAAAMPADETHRMWPEYRVRLYETQVRAKTCLRQLRHVLRQIATVGVLRHNGQIPRRQENLLHAITTSPNFT